MKIDVMRENKDEYVAPKEPAIVRVGRGRYLTIRGTGTPQGEEFREKVGALYGAAYTVKFALKKRGRDFKVGALEGLWTAVGRGGGALTRPTGSWRWKLAIRVPRSVTERALTAALAELRAKRGPVPTVRLETMGEGKTVQVLHVGAYRDEQRTIAKMETFAKQHRLRFRGAHHEIYISDPRRVRASRLRTILRHPVA